MVSWERIHCGCPGHHFLCWKIKIPVNFLAKRSEAPRCWRPLILRHLARDLRVWGWMMVLLGGFFSLDLNWCVSYLGHMAAYCQHKCQTLQIWSNTVCVRTVYCVPYDETLPPPHLQVFSVYFKIMCASIDIENGEILWACAHTSCTGHREREAWGQGEKESSHRTDLTWVMKPLLLGSVCLVGFYLSLKQDGFSYLYCWVYRKWCEYVGCLPNAVNPESVKGSTIS